MVMKPEIGERKIDFCTKWVQSHLRGHHWEGSMCKALQLRIQS